MLITPPVGRVDWARQHGARTSATAPHPSWMNRADPNHRRVDSAMDRRRRMPMLSGQGVTGPAPAAGPSHTGWPGPAREPCCHGSGTTGDSTAVLVHGRYRASEFGLDRHGRVPPEVNYYVGGNTKFYGAALFRLRPEDFGNMRHHSGLSPAGSRALAQLAAGRHPPRRARRDDVPPVRPTLRHVAGAPSRPTR